MSLNRDSVPGPFTGRLTSRPVRACVVAHTDLWRDLRVRGEAEMLMSDGWELDIICLRGPDEPAVESWANAMVHHLPGQRHRGDRMVTYMLEYVAFFLRAIFYVSRLSLHRHYSLIHVHNLPDFLVFTAVVPRLLGARVLLDIHDPLPDLYISKFAGRESHVAVRLARWLEKVSTAFADHVVTPGEPSRRRLVGRGLPPEKVTNILNSADPRVFRPIRPAGGEAAPARHFTLVYHGGIFKRYGLDLAIRAVHQLRQDIPGLQLHIVGGGDETESLKQLVEQLDLSEQVSLAGWIPPEKIPEFVAEADLGVVPYRQDTFTDLIYPTKAFEYIVMGIPVIMSGLAGVVELFPDVPDLFFPPDDVDALAQHILRLYREPERKRRLNEALQRAYAPYRLEGQRRTYLSLVERLVNVRGGADAAATMPR
jgi:glycosyltransferase involved in cell wall biosynthesis